MRAAGTARIASATIIVAAVLLELALFLDWRSPVDLGSAHNLTSIFGSVDRERALFQHLRHGQDGWTVDPLAAGLLCVLGVAALGYGALGAVARPLRAPVASLLGLAAAAAGACCTVKLTGSAAGPSHADLTAYVLRAYSVSPDDGVFVVAGRPQHGAGVVVALIASVMMLAGVAASVLRPGVRKRHATG